MSGDPEQEYFADGMAEEIITGLSRIKWLSVISRNSTSIYKDKPVVMKEVADKFGVRYVLRVACAKREIGFGLPRSSSMEEPTPISGPSITDRVLEDVFALQDEITMCVVGAIEPELWKAEIDRIKRQRPTNLNALRSCVALVAFCVGPHTAGFGSSNPILEDALKLEPDYAAAHAFLSRCFHHRYARAGLREEDRMAAIRTRTRRGCPRQRRCDGTCDRRPRHRIR